MGCCFATETEMQNDSDLTNGEMYLFFHIKA